ncbi:MAG: YhcH/YjgK/YiaL family protein [Eubacteriales bacterium]|nr:YhcH/YjgK/YiaL family protein [Clostridiales bacterium]
MIVDSVKNIGRYAGLGKNFETAIRFIQQSDIENMRPMDFQLDGTHVYGFVKEFPLKTPQEVKLEAHRRYADIQLVLGGKEAIYIAETDRLSPCVPYDEEKDIAFYDGEDQFPLHLEPMQFGIFFPWDAHRPCCLSGDADCSLKLVIKVEI